MQAWILVTSLIRSLISDSMDKVDGSSRKGLLKGSHKKMSQFGWPHIILITQLFLLFFQHNHHLPLQTLSSVRPFLTFFFIITQWLRKRLKGINSEVQLLNFLFSTLSHFIPSSLQCSLGQGWCLNQGLTPYLNKLMWWTVYGEGNRGWWIGGVGLGGLYQFHTVGSRGILIPFHLSLSRCHSPPQVVIATQALTASSRFLKEGKKRIEKKHLAKPDDECIQKETKKMTYHFSTDVDWCCITRHSNKHRKPKYNVHFVVFKGNSWITL